MSLQTGGVSSWNGRTGPVAPEQGDYTPGMVGAVPAPVGPIPRYGAAGAPDANDGVMIFGGLTNTLFGLPSGDTWVYNYNAAGNPVWTKYFPSTPPPPRYWSAAAYDYAAATLMFGGVGNAGTGSPLADTWAWNGSQWEQMTPQHVPPARYGHVMAYDQNTGRILMFGGITGAGTLLADTWLWTGSDWAPQAPATSPPARYWAAVGRITVNPYQGVLIFGGVGAAGTSTPLGDTWHWNGATWAELAPTTSPSPRYGAQMVGDYDLGNGYLFGGISSPYNYLGDLWEWEPATPAWVAGSAAAPIPGPRGYGNFVNWNNPGQPILFGGETIYGPTQGYLGDAWEFEAPGWAALSVGAPASNPYSSQNQVPAPTGSPTQIGPFGFDTVVTIAGGTVTEIRLANNTTGLTSGGFYLPSGLYMTVTWTAAPTIVAIPA